MDIFAAIVAVNAHATPSVTAVALLRMLIPCIVPFDALASFASLSSCRICASISDTGGAAGTSVRANAALDAGD